MVLGKRGAFLQPRCSWVLRLGGEGSYWLSWELWLLGMLSPLPWQDSYEEGSDSRQFSD